MTCDQIDPELLAYHFGTLDPGLRPELEAHLLDCRRCLEGYLALKREVELGEGEPGPSPAVRARVLRSFRAERDGLHPQPWRLWERPLAFGFAAASVFVAILTVQVLKHGTGEPPRRLADPPALQGR